MATFVAAAEGRQDLSADTGFDTITIPATAAAGDGAIMVVAYTDTTGTVAAPAGWKIESGPDVVGTSFTSYLISKQLDSTDPGKTLTIRWTGLGRPSTQMMIYRGTDLNTGRFLWNKQTTAGTSTTYPSMTNVLPGAFHATTVRGVSSGTAANVAMSTAFTQPTSNGRHNTIATTGPNLSIESGYNLVSSTSTGGGQTASVDISSFGINYVVSVPDGTPGGGTPAPEIPVAQFTGSPTNGTVPLTVTFDSSASTGGPFSAYAWDFGDGNTSTVANPTHQYTTAGTYTVTLNVTNANGTDSEVKTGYISAGTGSAPGTGSTYVSRSTAPLTTAQILARSNKVTPTGLFTTAWNDPSPTSDKTYDFRGATFHGYFWADAIFGFGTFSSPGTEHQRNNTPFQIGRTSRATRPAIVGGKQSGQQPFSLTWNSMKHGSHIQDAIDGGMSGDDAWGLISNNQNQDGDCRIYISEGSWGIYDGVRTQNTHDGFGMYGEGQTPSDTGTVYMRNCWVLNAHDDAIENDNSQLKLEVVDCLFENVYTFLSTRSPTTSGSPNAAKPQTIKDSIVRMWPFPGPYKEKTSVTASGLMYKMQSNSPPLIMDNVIIVIERANSASGYVLPNRTGLDKYTNVTLIWRGSGSYPAAIPPGVTLTTDLTKYTNAVADWKARHGVTNFDTVDMTKFLDGSGGGGGGTSGSAPVASFTQSTTSGFSPMAVQFTDTSTNFPTAWSWNFGDGSTSTLQNPSKTYSTPGTYSVSLSVSNSAGSSAVTKSGLITVSSAPVSNNLPGSIYGVEPECHGHVVPICDTNGNLYRVTEEYLGVAPQNTPIMNKSSDGGGTWAEVNKAGRPTSNDLESGWMVQDVAARKIYYALCDGSVFTIHGFNTSDHPTAPDRWSGVDEVAASGFSSGSRQWASLVRLSDGRMRAFYHVASGGTIETKVRAAGGGWSGTATVVAGDSYGPVPCVGALDKTHVFWHNFATKQIMYRNISSTGTMSTAVRVDTNGTNSSSRNFHAACNPVYYDANGVEVVTVMYAGSSGVRAITLHNGVAQAEVTLDTNAPTISPANTDGNTGLDGPCMHLAVHGNTVHAIWSRGSTGDLMYSTRTHGAAWTAPVILWNSGTSAAFWTYNNIYTRAGAVRMGYTYDIGPHTDNDSNVTYNEVILSSGGGGSPTVGRLRDRWNGSSLVRMKRERWNGSTLTTRVIEK